MKTKIISYGDDATGFHDKEMPKADLYWCFSRINNDWFC